MSQKPYIISIDTTADLPEDYIQEHELPVHSLHYIIDDKEYGRDLTELSDHDFYQALREGKLPSTSATNLAKDLEMMEESVKAGYDIIHLPLSSGLSSSYNNGLLAAQQIMEKYPQAKISVIDGHCATGALGCLVRTLVTMKEQGASYRDVVSEAYRLAPLSRTFFTVQNLIYMARGGRLKKSEAILGTAFKINPVLHVTETGTLELQKKVRGRKNALHSLADELAQLKAEGKELPSRVHITHGDCGEEALSFGEYIRETFDIQDIMYTYLSPTLGSHTGPEVMVLSYLLP